jgi:glycosyltransferase involved in cell wall biosynthesis
MIKILFYSDVREYGGHEAMTIAAVSYLACQPEIDVDFVFHNGNERLSDELNRIVKVGRLRLYPLPLKSECFTAFRPLAQLLRLPHLRRLMKSLAPDVVVISQGNIEVSWLGVLAAKRSGLRTITYIPMAQVQPLLGFMSGLRSLLDRVLYRLPDRYVTIGETAKRMLQEQGAHAEIDVVPNGIELEQRAGDRADFRQSCGISSDTYVAAVIGRIAFQQKAHDFLVRSVAEYRDRLKGVRICVIGDGPDEQNLRDMVRDLNLEDIVSILPWRRDRVSFYSAMDLLIIPSRFEGVPLVMLEAMWHGLPIVASNVDGMAEILPKHWLFRSGDAESLVSTFTQVRYADNTKTVAANRTRVAKEFGISQFQERFGSVVMAKLSGKASTTPRNTKSKELNNQCASELI